MTKTHVSSTASASSSASNPKSAAPLSLSVRNARVDDAEICARIVVEAYSHLVSTHLMYGVPTPASMACRIAYRTRDFQEELSNAAKNSSRYVVARLEETGQDIGMARWSTCEVRPEDPSMVPAVRAKALARREQFEAASRADDEAASQHTQGTPPARSAYDVDLAASLHEDMLRAYEMRWRGQGPHLYIHSVATLSGHQRLGAASLLLKAIVADADEKRIPAYLEATTEGYRLYEKHGFCNVGTLVIGHGDRSFPIALMTRPAIASPS